VRAEETYVGSGLVVGQYELAVFRISFMKKIKINVKSKTLVFRMSLKTSSFSGGFQKQRRLVTRLQINVLL
jgi:hypothetical protein